MSPIGRVFIVLNLALAGGFAIFAGTHLQRQHNYKEQLKATETKHETSMTAWNAERTLLTGERNTFEQAKTSRETELGLTKVRLEQTEDENKRLHGQIAALEGN
ncbi:MAG: hypothetical protein ABIP94_03080, partial [Planctomycetota bacterium]